MPGQNQKSVPVQLIDAGFLDQIIWSGPWSGKSVRRTGGPEIPVYDTGITLTICYIVKVVLMSWHIHIDINEDANVLTPYLKHENQTKYFHRLESYFHYDRMVIAEIRLRDLQDVSPENPEYFLRKRERTLKSRTSKSPFNKLFSSLNSFSFRGKIMFNNCRRPLIQVFESLCNEIKEDIGFFWHSTFVQTR